MMDAVDIVKSVLSSFETANLQSEAAKDRIAKAIVDKLKRQKGGE
jgi:hypothetical protein